ncbi:hypothetical protein A8C32_09060 [Flavivirga aquatica]|uniref:Uncharacterized protein n=1 Tax=Flavivirga aquatica TaxID=1849968 RepID=A0A1E5SJK4_9FLAO|nr:hypothetical protein [Flavivirga aquatica]OEJ99305.1 hypothetical protein A8C32_09060 [Flavivirga aquatica]
MLLDGFGHNLIVFFTGEILNLFDKGLLPVYKPLAQALPFNASQKTFKFSGSGFKSVITSG